MAKKDKLYNMRVSEDWLNQRRVNMERNTSYKNLSGYLIQMIALGESIYDGMIREEEEN